MDIGNGIMLDKEQLFERMKAPANPDCSCCELWNKDGPPFCGAIQLKLLTSTEVCGLRFFKCKAKK